MLLIGSRQAGREANMSDSIEEDSITRTPTSNWTPWAIWNLPVVGPTWVHSRTVHVTEHVVTKHHQETYVPKACPPGYMTVGGGWCEKPPESRDPNDPTSYGTYSGPDRVNVGTHVIASDTFTEADYEWDEVQWEHKPFSKMGKRPEFERSSRYAFLEEPLQTGRGRLGSGAAGTGASGGPGPGGGGKNVISLPGLFETDRLSIGDSRAKLSIVVDGVERRPGQALEGHKLGRGFHVIDLEGEIPGFGVGRLQLLLNVISPIKVEVEPIAEVEISDDAIGGVVELRLTNRSASTHGVRLDVDAVPRGWTAAFAEEPFVVLAPEEAAVLPIQVNRMYVTDEAWEPAAFAVRASVVGTRASDVVSSFLVRPRGRRPRKRVVEGLPANFAPPESIAPSRRAKAAKKKRRAKATTSRA
jgi:hypothetical protein